MLGAEHAVTRPAGLRPLMIGNAPASPALWVQEANGPGEALPPDVQPTLLALEPAGTTGSLEYMQAVRVVHARHLCLADPWPAEVARTWASIKDGDFLDQNGQDAGGCFKTLPSFTLASGAGAP